MNSPGTTSPSRVFTKTMISGRVRRASGATTCCACESGGSRSFAHLLASAGRRNGGRGRVLNGRGFRARRGPAPPRRPFSPFHLYLDTFGQCPHCPYCVRIPSPVAGSPFSLVSHYFGPVLAVKGPPLARFAPWTATGPCRGAGSTTREKGGSAALVAGGDLGVWYRCLDFESAYPRR